MAQYNNRQQFNVAAMSSDSTISAEEHTAVNALFSPPEGGFEEGEEVEFFFLGHGFGIDLFSGAVGEGDLVFVQTADGFAQQVGKGFGNVHIRV